MLMDTSQNLIRDHGLYWICMCIKYLVWLACGCCVVEVERFHERSSN